MRSSTISRSYSMLSAVAFLLLMGCGLWLYFAFLHSYDELDRRMLTDDAQRVHRTFKERFTVLESKVADWGSWDEAFKYVTEKDPAFAKANFTENVIGGLKITALAYLDPKLEPITVQYLENGKTLVNLDPAKLPFLNPTKDLIKNSSNKIVLGLVDFLGRPALIAAKSVTRADGSGPPIGRVIFIRTIDEDMLRALSEQTLHPVTVVAKPDDSPDVDFIDFAHGTIALHDTYGLAYLPLNTTDGVEMGFLRVEIPRDVALFGRSSTRGIIGIFALFVFVGLFATMAVARLTSLRQGFSKLIDANRALQEREAYLRALLDSIPGYVSWFNRSLHYLGVNKKLARDYGRQPEDFIGQPIGMNGQTSRPDLKTELNNFFNEPAQSKQISILMGDGDAQKKFLVCFEKYDNNSAIVAVGVDLTESWKHEQQALRDRQIALNASRLSALGEMAGGIAHEINNPLAIIEGSCRRLRKSVAGHDIVESIKSLQTIEKTTLRISKIVNGLRTFARDGGHDPFTYVAVADIVEDAIGLCGERFRMRGVELRLKENNAINPIRCRPVQIGQVLVNLLNNAFDAVVELDERWVEVEVKEIQSNLQIIITDSGRGIPSDVSEKMMNPFFTTKPVGKGTGLGLSISASIIQDHGGTLIYDKISSNTRFIISLSTAQPQINVA